MTPGPKVKQYEPRWRCRACGHSDLNRRDHAAEAYPRLCPRKDCRAPAFVLVPPPVLRFEARPSERGGWTIWDNRDLNFVTGVPLTEAEARAKAAQRNRRGIPDRATRASVLRAEQRRLEGLS